MNGFSDGSCVWDCPSRRTTVCTDNTTVTVPDPPHTRPHPHPAHDRHRIAYRGRTVTIVHKHFSASRHVPTAPPPDPSVPPDSSRSRYTSLLPS
jgi:hypothetical protein